MSKAKFLTRLALARGAEWTDEHIDVYERVLEDVPLATLERVCLEFARAPRGEFQAAMPSAGEIRFAALHPKKAASIQRPGQSFDITCDTCADTGWIERQCEGGEARSCGGAVCRGPHRFVVRCFHALQAAASPPPRAYDRADTKTHRSWRKWPYQEPQRPEIRDGKALASGGQDE